MPPNSSDSPKPSETHSSPVEPSLEAPLSSPRGSAAATGEARPFAWRANAVLFLATVASVFITGVATDGAAPSSREAIFHGLEFTFALMTILLAHEFGHYIAARIHKVDASLPFFIPMPLISPFGTMGAFIRMRGTIPTRKALLDIGASGPLAGMFFAIPLYFWGVLHSKIIPVDGTHEGMQLGESLMLRFIEHLTALNVPEGMDVELSPIAFAAWAGMFVTMINLIPVGQLDGGHVAFSLLGKRQDRAAVVIHRSMLAFFFVSLASYLFRDMRAGMGFHRIGAHVSNSLSWLVWFELIAVLGTLSSPADGRRAAPDPQAITIRTRIVATLGLALLAGFGREKEAPLLWIAWFLGLGVLLAMEVRGGALKKHALFDHPPAGTAPLGAPRIIVAVVTLLLFALLFMPTPISM